MSYKAIWAYLYQFPFSSGDIFQAAGYFSRFFQSYGSLGFFIYFYGSLLLVLMLTLFLPAYHVYQ